MGTNYSKFKIPVCNSFKATIKDEQICYEIDLEEYKSERDLVKQLQEGLVLYLDYNEDKQLTVEKYNGKSALVYLNTISMMIILHTLDVYYCQAQVPVQVRSSPVQSRSRSGPGQVQCLMFNS